MSHETIYGEKALKARKEILAVRQKHYELLKQRNLAEYGTARWGELTREIHANMDRLTEIENRYFGEPDALS